MKLEGTKEELEALKNILGKVELLETDEEEEAPSFEIPKGYVLKEEPKSQRLQLLLKASTLKALKDMAAKDGESVNAICNNILEKYLKGAKAK